MRTLRLLSVAILIFVGSVAIFAQPQSARAVQVTISPPRFDAFANPGDILNETLKVHNDTGSTQTYKTIVADFSASDDTGGISVSDDPNTPKTSYSLARWVKVEPSQFTVDANQDAKVAITIVVPQGAEPGGHYATVEVQIAGNSVSGGSGASVETRLNSLILLRVSGAITEKLNLDTFKASEPYYSKAPVNFTMRSTNSGNVHDAPEGSIVITDMFNHKVKELPIPVANVLPGSARLLNIQWTDNLPIGRFTATLVATYGQSKTPLTASTTFIIFPISLAITILVVILLIVLLITQRRRLKKILHSLTSD